MKWKSTTEGDPPMHTPLWGYDPSDEEVYLVEWYGSRDNDHEAVLVVPYADGRTGNNIRYWKKATIPKWEE